VVANEKKMIQLTNEMRTQSSKANTGHQELLLRVAEAIETVGQGTQRVAVATSSMQQGGAKLKYLSILTLTISSLGVLIAALSTISS
jgi:hypothetical protein